MVNDAIIHCRRRAKPGVRFIVYIFMSCAFSLNRSILKNQITRDFPKFKNAKGYEAVLEPGEVLYLPMYW